MVNPDSESVRSVGDIVGNYCLVNLSSEGPMTRCWEAEQVSMSRQVMLEMLKVAAVNEPGVKDGFLSDVKVKALVSAPGVGMVYEAYDDDDATFFARERIHGQSLQESYEAGRQYTPMEVVVLLEQVSDAMLHLSKDGVATVDYGLEDFIIGEGGKMRLMNLAVFGTRDEEVDTRAKVLLGAYFGGAVQQGVSGSTRILSLTSWMRGEGREVPLSWTEIIQLCHQVRDQLLSPPKVEPPIIAEAACPVQPVKLKKKSSSATWAALGGVALIGGMIAFFVISDQGSDKNAGLDDDQEKAEYVEIPVGQYELSDGKMKEVHEAFEISRVEVTIARYSQFLASANLEQYQHPDQPKSKKSHVPNHWSAMLTAAKKGQKWKGRQMSISCPVVFVDWWDAYAFAKWSGGRLPTMNEWAAASVCSGAPQKSAPWGEVRQESGDVTGAGIYGMAGGVSEWTLESEISEKNPLAPKKPVLVGGSHMKKEGGILLRSWIQSRDVRRVDLGLRIVKGK